MTSKDFNVYYEYAQRVNVANDDMFNRAGYFWFDLTEKQLAKMVALMVAQGAPVFDNPRNKSWDHCIRIGQTAIELKVD